MMYYLVCCRLGWNQMPLAHELTPAGKWAPSTEMDRLPARGGHVAKAYVCSSIHGPQIKKHHHQRLFWFDSAV